MKTDAKGIIRDPGKFEGEHQDILYWYGCMLNGDGEPIGDPEADLVEADVFEIEAEDLPKLSHPNKTKKYAILWHSESGFESLDYTDKYPFLKSY